MNLLSASVLACDFSRLGEQIAMAERCGSDYIHLDVMDGHFVPNLTFGPMFVEAVRPYAKIFFDVHMMVTDPMDLAEAFVKAGADGITIHAESFRKTPVAAGTPGNVASYMEDIDYDRLIAALLRLREMGVRPGCSISPLTPVDVIKPVLPYVDMVLIMTVQPGYGGQKLIPETLDKVRTLRAWVPELNIEVDGGINNSTLAETLAAGANVIVMGTGFFRAEDPAEAARVFHAM